MIAIRDAVLEQLKDRFPALGNSVRAFTGRFGEVQEGQLSYPSPAIIVSILPVVEAPKDVDPWPLEITFGIVVTAKEARASESDRVGWRFALEVAQIIYRNCWGFQKGMEITPAVIDSIQKQEQVNPLGAPTGVYYWTITFHQYATFEVILTGLKT